jgi:hypothetical protein
LTIEVQGHPVVVRWSNIGASAARPRNLWVGCGFRLSAKTTSSVSSVNSAIRPATSRRSAQSAYASINSRIATLSAASSRDRPAWSPAAAFQSPQVTFLLKSAARPVRHRTQKRIRHTAIGIRDTSTQDTASGPPGLGKLGVVCASLSGGRARLMTYRLVLPSRLRPPPTTTHTNGGTWPGALGPGRSSRSSPRDAATLTSICRQAATMTGRVGASSWPRCRATSPPPSASRCATCSPIARRILYTVLGGVVRSGNGGPPAFGLARRGPAPRRPTWR